MAFITDSLFLLLTYSHSYFFAVPIILILMVLLLFILVFQGKNYPWSFFFLVLLQMALLAFGISQSILLVPHWNMTHPLLSYVISFKSSQIDLQIQCNLSQNPSELFCINGKKQTGYSYESVWNYEYSKQS